MLLRPRPHWKSLQRSPDYIARFKRPTSKGGGEWKEREKRRVKERERKDRQGEEGEKRGRRKEETGKRGEGEGKELPFQNVCVRF